MSLTNTHLIQRTVQSTTEQHQHSSGSRRFLLPAEGPEEDMGLVFRLDSGVGSGVDTSASITSQSSPSGNARATIGVSSTPVPAKLCGQSKAVAQWALFTWVLHVHKVSDWIQKLLIRLLPVFLYMSLLVGAIQALGVLYLLTSSILPLGAYFLLGCISLMGYFYVSTVPCQQAPTSSPRRSTSPPVSPVVSHLHLS